MFHCYVHGWSHIERPCPLCNPLRTYSSGSTEILIPLPEKEKPVDMYQGLNDEDLRRLRRADVMYIAQLIEDIDCADCGQPFMWFSGVMDQRCEACRTGEPEPQYYYIEMNKDRTDYSAVIYTEKVDGLDEDAICAVRESDYLAVKKRLEGALRISRERNNALKNEELRCGKYQRLLMWLRLQLKKLSDVTSAFDIPGRTVSYVDHELRGIARETLTKLNELEPK